MTLPLDEDVFSPVSSLDAIQILLLIDILNDLVADVACAYLHTHTKEKIYTNVGPKEGK